MTLKITALRGEDEQKELGSYESVQLTVGGYRLNARAILRDEDGRTIAELHKQGFLLPDQRPSTKRGWSDIVISRGDE